MAISQSAACACCDKENCLAVVIIPALPNYLKRVEMSKQCYELVCPACHRFFSVSFRNVEDRDVTGEQLTQGFIDGQLFNSSLAQ